MSDPLKTAIRAPGRLKDIPTLSPSADNVKQVVDAISEAVQINRGYRGDPLDKGLTLRDAVNVGLLQLGGTGGGSGGLPGGVKLPPPANTDPTPDLTPPPTPEHLVVTAGITNLYISFDAPTYTQGHGHARTNFYGAKRASGDPPKVFNDAVLIGAAFDARSIYVHPTEPSTTWAIWVKFQTFDGIESVAPAGGVNGVEATTGEDVALLLEALTGQITESQLYSSLGDRIDLIDGSGPGSVNARIAAVSAGTGDNTAAILAEASARATVDNYLGAQYTVRAQITAGGRTVVGGFGLSATSVGGASATIDFGVRADKFWIGAPVGATGVSDVLPFIVQTSDTVINGVTIPKGVYMDAAFINNLTAMVARLGAAWIDNAMIGSVSAGKLTVGDGTIGGNLRSSGYVAGSAGWQVQPNGFAEFSNAVIRGSTYTGTIFANAGTIGGITIGAHDIRSSNYVPTSAGFRINDDGSAEFYNVTARGNITANSLNAATGTFTGSLVAATGTFAGSLSAATGTFAGALSAATGSFAGSLSAATGTFAGTLTAGALVVAGGNLFLPVYATSGGPTTLSTSAWTTLATAASINPGSTGSSCIIVTIRDVDSFDPETESTGAFPRPNSYRITRNGSVIATFEGESYTVLDTPGGAAVYALQGLSGPSSVPGVTQYRTILCMGVTR